MVKILIAQIVILNYLYSNKKIQVKPKKTTL